MAKNKKKMPGRPKKEFISKKPQIKKSGPGRPRKDQKNILVTNQVPYAVVSHVAKSVDDSKKKDMIILSLFLLSFILFIVSLYFTFMKDKKADDLAQGEISEIVNVETGNIDYTATKKATPSQEQSINPSPLDIVDITNTSPENTTAQNFADDQQTILDFYQAVNSLDTVTINTMVDTRLKQSNIFKTYYSKNWLSKFSEVILAPKIVVSNIQKEASTTNNPDIKNFSYTLEYTLVSSQQKMTEERSTVLIKKGEEWKIGKLMCETKGCSTMPFFNPDKYKN